MAQAKAQDTKNLLGLAGVPLVMVLGNSMLIPILPTMETELGLTSFQSSFIITAFSIAAGLVIPLAGYLSDRFNRKIVVTIALSLYGLGGLLAGLSALWFDDPYLMIMVGRVLQGVGAAGTSPIAMALVGDLFNGASESRALGLLETSNGMGKVLSPILGSLFALITWYTVFLAFPIICGAVLLLFLFMVKEKKKKKEPMPVGQYIHSIKTVFAKNGKWLVPAFFIGSICLFTLFGVLFYLSDLLEEEYGIDGVAKGGLLAIPLLAMSITAYITGAIIKKKLKLMRFFIIMGLLALTASYFGSSFVENNAYILIGVLVIGSIGTGMILPCLNSMIIGSVKKSERGMITSLYNGVRFIGVAVGPPVFTWLISISANVMFYTIAGLTALFAVIAFFFITPQTVGQQQQQAASREGEEEMSHEHAKATEKDADESNFINREGFEDVAVLLGVKREEPDQKVREVREKQLGFDPTDMMHALLDKAMKGKDKDKDKAK
ncbi:MFS transporter [Brevibacillus dissolubilis]|uniref:MFS transporter n=1 Tax=Brevibacillus dissolubilis TaxID=1844116 RepID=UPI001115E0F2|nr:MFS transporter [Brevibacillus dissolubilis]